MKRRVKCPNRRPAADEVVAIDLRGVMASGHREAKEVKEVKEVKEPVEVWVVEWAARSPE